MTPAKHTTPRELWDQIRAKRRESWKSGKCVRVETIVKQLPALALDPNVLAEVAFQEFCLREEQGEELQSDDFITRFPTCSDALTKLFAKHLDIASGGSGVTDTVEFPSAGSTFAGMRVPESEAVEAERTGKGKRFGRYLVVDQIGQGAMGVVYLARDTRLDRPVALKLPKFSTDAVESGLRARFYREARAAAAIDHPNICPVYDIGEVRGQDFIAMAYVAGPTLEAMTHEGGRIELLEACQIVRDVALALDECHLQGVIHRDIKPSNIIVNQRGTPIIMDFGLASMENSARVTLDQQLIGTLRYMSPEQVTGRLDEVGPTSDIYSLGVTLYEMLTAAPPFGGENFIEVANKIELELPVHPSELCPGLDVAIDQICLRALAKEANDRFATMGEFAEALSVVGRLP
ncbi:MAG: serine/threonine protein kinase [Planctomycetes bacterium]|nr:serine/threonine protein kinase [Planctomycetota bacterium]